MILFIVIPVLLYLFVALAATVPETRMIMKAEEKKIHDQGHCGAKQSDRRRTKEDCDYWHDGDCWISAQPDFVYVADLDDVFKGFGYGMAWMVRWPGLLLYLAANTEANKRAAELKRQREQEAWQRREDEAQVELEKMAAEHYADLDKFINNTELELNGLPVVEDHPELEAKPDPKAQGRSVTGTALRRTSASEALVYQTTVRLGGKAYVLKSLWPLTDEEVWQIWLVLLSDKYGNQQKRY